MLISLKTYYFAGPLTEYGPEAQAFINIYDQENKLWPDVGLNFIALPFVSSNLNGQILSSVFFAQSLASTLFYVELEQHFVDLCHCLFRPAI